MLTILREVVSGKSVSVGGRHLFIEALIFMLVLCLWRFMNRSLLLRRAPAWQRSLLLGDIQLEINDRSTVINSTHLSCSQLSSVSGYEYFTTLPQQYGSKSKSRAVESIPRPRGANLKTFVFTLVTLQRMECNSYFSVYGHHFRNNE